MAKRQRGLTEIMPFHERVPRSALPPRVETASDDALGMTHEQLVASLRTVEGLVDVGHDPPNFHFRSRPFLHFHTGEEGTYADVRFGSGDFEPMWASTSYEREALFARVCDHIESLQNLKKSRRKRGA